MSAELKDTFFMQYGTRLQAASTKNTVSPFKEHVQFPLLTDILSRMHHHHVLLRSDLSPFLLSQFLEGFSQHLTQQHIPYPLRNADILHLRLENVSLTDMKQLSIERDFDLLRETLRASNKYLIIALTTTDLFSKEPKKADERFLRRQLDTLLDHPHCRLLLIDQSKSAIHQTYLDMACVVALENPTDAELMTALKQQRIQLELFHHVLIPEELLSQALNLAERYLGIAQKFEKALQLLDSCAARASANATETSEATTAIKPVVTTNLVLQVLSDWTNIPASHIQINQFKHAEFIQGLRQCVFGQEPALTLIGQALLQAQARLQHASGPFCAFLFAGPAHAGKSTTAHAITELLFKQLNVLYYAQPSPSDQALSEIKLQRCLDKHVFSLYDALIQSPYAVLLFENVDTYSATLLAGIQELLHTGYLRDAEGREHDFKQAIVIFTTTAGNHTLSALIDDIEPNDDIYTMDLMQLVMNESKQEQRPENPTLSGQQLAETILPDIAEVLPASLYTYLHIIPFLPLDKSAIEKIIRLKLKILGKQLDARYGIELGYAPEVVRFLTHQQTVHPDKALKQLYFCVEQVMLSQADHPHRSNQLFLQLNETGQLLRCDWLAATTSRQHVN